MDSELREILEALARLPPERIAQIRDLVVAMQEQEAAPAEFMAEVAAFERMRPELRVKYPGRVIAVYRGEVIAVGSDKMQVLDTVLREYGAAMCYIDSVDPALPRRVSSAWVAK
jgi:hypothetical protein